MNRGDVVLVRFPHPSGVRGKKRPAVVVQSDAYNQAVKTLVVAEVTKNLALAHDPACLFIDVSTPEGQATGLKRDSVVSVELRDSDYHKAVTAHDQGRLVRCSGVLLREGRAFRLHEPHGFAVEEDDL
jgi:mRNA-degrading endonuclease toxin of MazEF toxin-antitoxin module